jgi:hypothetical protein
MFEPFHVEFYVLKDDVNCLKCMVSRLLAIYSLRPVLFPFESWIDASLKLEEFIWLVGETLFYMSLSPRFACRAYFILCSRQF